MFKIEWGLRWLVRASSPSRTVTEAPAATSVVSPRVSTSETAAPI